MLEKRGDLWNLPSRKYDLCITTNGFVKKDGSCVMGRGCAYKAKQIFRGIEFDLGKKILEEGNNVHYFRYFSFNIYSFPVKHNWWEEADIELIKKSCRQLVKVSKFVERKYWYDTPKKILIPRPGCGNGNLIWENVKPEIETILLDNKFVAISY